METKISKTSHNLPNPRQVILDLGRDPSKIKAIELLSERHGHAIWRITMPERSYILKWLPEADARTEIESYLLLQRLGVPVLPLFGHTPQALLLEDLAHSDSWRLAVETDIAKPETGVAVAGWYKIFHTAGETLLDQGHYPSFLTRETDALDPDSILAAGRSLGLASYPAMQLASTRIDLLKAAIERLSFTLNYNDFYWTNLALSHGKGEQMEAIIFDYHLLGLGMRYSDCRNVTGSLSGAAVPAFWDTYGDFDPCEQVLDRPLAALYGLVAASRLPKFPHWAKESRDGVINGDLERDLIEAIELAQTLENDSYAILH
jgi:hypothetical protein